MIRRDDVKNEEKFCKKMKGYREKKGFGQSGYTQSTSDMNELVETAVFKYLKALKVII